jgi:hypothetical protein
MRYMSIDIVRLFGSRFHAIANDAEWRAGMTLWLKSFHQRPAGSLPADDVELCRLAEFGRDLETWRRVKDMALHGWYRCADNRLYHDVVAVHVNDIAVKHQTYASRARKASAARWGKPAGTGDVKPQQENGTTDMFGKEARGDEQGGNGQTVRASSSDKASRVKPVACPDDVPEGVWRDFLALRKAKKAPLTETALEAIRTEAQKAKISLSEALQVCCARGWQAFRSDWNWQGGGANGTTLRVMAPRTMEPDWSKMDYGDEIQSI